MRNYEYKDELVAEALTFAFIRRSVKIGANSIDFEVIERNQVALVIPITNDNQVVFIDHFRAPVNDFILELPAGKKKQNEDIVTTAKRELHEETGYIAGKIERIFEFYSAPHFSDEHISVFVASNLSFDKRHLEPKEIIHNHLISIENLKENLYKLLSYKCGFAQWSSVTEKNRPVVVVRTKSSFLVCCWRQPSHSHRPYGYEASKEEGN